MYRNNFPHNPYGGGPPFNAGEGGFRPPMDRPSFQSSPRYHQQFVPPHSGPGGPDFTPNRDHPRYHPHPGTPRGGFQSPPHMGYDGPSPQHSHSYRGNSGRRHHFSPGNGGRGRGKFNHRGNSSSSSNSDFNPGGSDDIRLYYSPGMTEDPWAGLPPVPAPQQRTASHSQRSTPSRT